MADSTTPRIVVGLDGSAPSVEALRWAVNQAALTGATVQAVSAWDYPVSAAWAPIADAGDLESECRQRLAKVIAEVVGPNPPATVDHLVVRGHPATVLLRAARDAQMLVVGCRGHGGFVGSLLGSVSRYCVQHASCPVLVIRGPVCQDPRTAG